MDLSHIFSLAINALATLLLSVGIFSHPAPVVQQATPKQAANVALTKIDEYLFKDSTHVYLYSITMSDWYPPTGTRATTTIEGADPATFTRLSLTNDSSYQEGSGKCGYYKDKNKIYAFSDYWGMGGHRNTITTLSTNVREFQIVTGNNSVDAKDNQHSYKCGKVVK